MIALTKALHIAALSVWCAGLIALPIILHVHGRSPAMRTEAGYAEFRLLSHRTYIALVTPAAVVAIAAGTGLILLEGLRAPWLIAKLAAVVGMVLLHAWFGHVISRTGQERGLYRPPLPWPGLAAGLGLMAVTLWLVLAKPDLAPLAHHLPEWLLHPRGRSLPPALVPI